jgi:molecular chaperone Hsp33
MEDHLIRATALDGKVRAYAAYTTNIASELHNRHRTSPVATAALGRLATAGVMMGAMLKGNERLTLQMKGNGPLGHMVVDANAAGEVRGYVDNPFVDLPPTAEGKLDVGGAVGKQGYLYVIKDLGLKEPYRGGVPLVSGEVAEDVTYYFAKSEQTPSAVALSVLVNPDHTVKAAGGFILQLMPGLSEIEISDMERRLGELPPLSALLGDGMPLEQLLSQIVQPVRVLDRMNIRFRCQCSRERVESTLISLGREEIETILNEDGKAEVICHFCNEAYKYDAEMLQSVLAKMSK